MSNENNSCIPRLRFPGFEGEWVEKPLGKVCDNILVGFPFKGQDITDDSTGHPILRAYSIGEGVVRHGKDYDKYYPYDTKALEKYKVKVGDIVVSMDGSVGRNIALVSKEENNYLLIQRVARLRITDYPIHLIYQQIISQRFKDYATGEKVGAVIAHISQKQIESFPIYSPRTHPEQQKIASCLSELDNLIAAQGQKVDALKEKKKGLMQQLFPQPGETTPRLRFPGFEGEWEEKKLGDVFKRLTSKNAENNKNVLTISAQYGLISQLDFFKKSVSAVDVTGYYLLQKGDFAYNKSSSQGKPVGAIKPLKLYDKGVVSTLYICFRCLDPKAVGFWEQYFDAGIFDKEIMSIAQEGARNHGLLNVPTNDFFGLAILMPKPAEQQKIASCLSSLDDLIAAESAKVEALKDHKKGLMQQLFPQGSEISRFSDTHLQRDAQECDEPLADAQECDEPLGDAQERDTP